MRYTEHAVEQVHQVALMLKKKVKVLDDDSFYHYTTQ